MMHLRGLTYTFLLLAALPMEARSSIINNATAADITAEAIVVMNQLIYSYTPGCMPVQIVTGQINPISSFSSTLKAKDQSKGLNILHPSIQHAGKLSYTEEQPTIILNLQNITQSINVIEYLYTNTEKVTKTGCVSFVLPGPPDSRLLPVLTDPTSSKRLTRYFLVHTQTSTEAEQFLLDQRLGKEENVAALVQEESQNKSYWRVLIRQLLHPSGSPQVFTVNRWSRDTGLTSTENIFPEQMANFYGQKLTGVTLKFRPFIAYEKIEGSFVVQPKPCIDIFLLDVIAYKLNFTYDIVIPEDGFWGGRKDDGSFQGIVGEVESGRANFSLLLSRTLARDEAVDFTRMYFKDPLTFLTATSPPGSPWSKVLTPFRMSVWLCVLVSVGGGSLLYHVIYHVQAPLTSSRLLSSHAFMHVLASFLGQSLYTYVSLQAGRIFLGFWLMYSFLVTSYYKTSLTSTLAVPFDPPAINTLQQLYQSDYQYGIKPKTSQHQYFTSSDIGLYRDMLQRMSFYTNDENLRQAAEGSHAFISYRSFLTFSMTLHNSDLSRKSDLRIATEEFFPGGYAWAVPKGAPYRRGFDRVMLWCEEAGLIEKWFGDLTSYYVREAKVQQPVPDEMQMEQNNTELPQGDMRQVAFSLDHLQGLFFMLLLGYGVGLMLLVVELLLSRLY